MKQFAFMFSCVEQVKSLIDLGQFHQSLKSAKKHFVYAVEDKWHGYRLWMANS